METWQEEEARKLREKLTNEYEMLLAYQSQQRKEMRNAHERESMALREKVAMRKTEKEKKVTHLNVDIKCVQQYR
jgi:hypothetical protein